MEAIGISLCESVQEGIVPLLRPIRILQEVLVLALERDNDPDAQESERHDRRDIAKHGAFRSGVDLLDVRAEDALRGIAWASSGAISASIEKDVLTTTEGRKIMVK
jgi:hypothetical protein